MATKYDLLKYVYDNTEDKDEIVNQFPEDIRESMKQSLDTGDEGLFEQLMTPTSMSTNGPEQVTEVAPAPVSIETSTLPDGDVTDIAQDNLQAIVQMNNEVHEAAPEEIEALPEDVQEGVEVWRDASEDMSRLIIMATHDALKGFDCSEEQVLCTGATIAKDLQDSGYGRTSLSRASDNLGSLMEAQAYDKLCMVKDELDSLRCSAEELVDYLSDKDNLGLTPSQRDELVDIILENGIFTDDADHDVRKDVMDVINTSGDYSMMDASVKLNLLNDFSGYEFSMEECDPYTCDILSACGSFDGSYSSVCEALDMISQDFAAMSPEEFRQHQYHIGVSRDNQRYNQKLNYKTDRVKAKEAYRSDRARAAEAYDTLLESNRSAAELAAINKAQALGVAGINANSANTVAATNAEASKYAARMAAESANTVAATNANASKYASKQATKQAKLDKHLTATDTVGKIADNRKDVELQKLENAQKEKNAEWRYRTAQLKADSQPVGFFQNNYEEFQLGPIKYGHGKRGAFDRVSTYVTDEVTNYLNKKNARMSKLANAQAKADARVKVAQSKALANMARYNSNTTKDAVGLAYAQNNYLPMTYGNFSESNDATEDQVLMQDEALEALVAKYTMLPTLEAKNAMVEDALAHGVPEEYINAMIERSKGEFSEDEADNSEATEMDAQAVLDSIEALGSDEIAQDGEVTNPTDPLDGTLPAGGIIGEGATQEEMIQGSPDISTDPAAESAPVESDEAFETIV